MNRAQISASGSQVATPADARRITATLLAHVGREGAIRAADLAVEAGVAGRTARAAYSALDGDAFVLARCADGLYLATTPAEAASLTAELRSRAIEELGRPDRRDAFWARQSAVVQLSLIDLMKESA